MSEIATIIDANEILQLQKLAYQSEAAIYNDYTIAPLLQPTDDMISDLREKIVLIEIMDSRIVGSVRGHVQDCTGYIGRLIVHPEYQNRGIGTSLMEAIEQHLSQAKRFELFTGHKSERNLRLYEKLGYHTFRSEWINGQLMLVYMEKLV